MVYKLHLGCRAWSVYTARRKLGRLGAGGEITRFAVGTSLRYASQDKLRVPGER